MIRAPCGVEVVLGKEVGHHILCLADSLAIPVSSIEQKFYSVKGK